MRFVANGHVRETKARLVQIVEAPNARKASSLGQEWARENALAFDGIETEQEHVQRVYTCPECGRPLTQPVQGDGTCREQWHGRTPQNATLEARG